VATDDNFWAKFRRWRRKRPFWGGLFLILSAILFFLTSNLGFSNFEIHLGPTGFLSYVIPLVVLLCGLLSWVSPEQRLFYGIIALVTALYSMIGLNFGGFGVSMLAGFVGGALVVAWGPPRIRPGAAQDSPPDGDSGDDAAPLPGEAATERIPFDEPAADDSPTEEPPTEDIRPAIVPGMEPEGPPRRAFGGRALAVGALALGVAASLLVAGGSMPARAEVECPEGLPSRTVSPSATSEAPSSPTPSVASSAVPSGASELISHPSAPVSGAASVAGSKSAPVAGSKLAPVSRSASAPSTVSAAHSPAATAASDGDGGLLDGVGDVVDGVGHLLGIGGDPSPSGAVSPSTSPTPSSLEPTASPDPTTSVDPTASSDSTAVPTKAGGSPSKPASPSAPTSRASSAAVSAPEPDPSGSELPCLGPRVYGMVADSAGIPVTADKPGLLKVNKLTLVDATYDGVADLPTGTKGAVKALQFTMKTAINEGFDLAIDEPGGSQTVIKSDKLTTDTAPKSDRNVRFYTTKFEGKFFGVLPMTFTVEQPPPVMFDLMVFTDVTIELSYIRCDVLTTKPQMTLTEVS
jgi:hypothetical protein